MGSGEDDGLLGVAWYYTKRILLWHVTESFEEPTGSGAKKKKKKKEVLGGTGVHGKKLRAAVNLLKKAVEPGNQDAVFLLAEMSFVCAHPDERGEWWMDGVGANVRM